MDEKELAALQPARAAGMAEPSQAKGIGAWRFDAVSVLAWAAVGIPLAWGFWITVVNALALFQ